MRMELGCLALISYNRRISGVRGRPRGRWIYNIRYIATT